MKTLVGLIGLVGLMGMRASASTNLYAFPTRMIGQQAVSLAPLIEWWKIADAAHSKKEQAALGPRPMHAWVEIRSESWSEENFGWIVGADLLTSPRDREAKHEVIFIKVAPSQYRARFDWLVERNKELLAIQERGYNAFGDGAQARENKMRGIAAGEEREAVLREIKQYPSPREFKLDLFALATGETYRGMPVYDVGLK